MKWGILLSGAVLVVVLWGRSVSAESPQSGPTCCKTGECSPPILKGCPDDYCRKPMPAIHCMECGGPDDYCRKPWPRIWQLSCCGGTDDYDRKACPPACRPMDTSQYRCVSLRQCGSTPCTQQQWQCSPSSHRLEKEGGRPNEGVGSGPLIPNSGATNAMRPLSPYHPHDPYHP
jgi:hypothetical protein